MKMLACLVDHVICSEVAAATENMVVETITAFDVLRTINLTRLHALIDYYVCIIVPVLNFCLLVYGCHFMSAIMT